MLSSPKVKVKVKVRTLPSESFSPRFQLSLTAHWQLAPKILEKIFVSENIPSLTYLLSYLLHVELDDKLY